MRYSALSAMCIRGVILTLCALILLASGCASSAGLTGAQLPPAPLTPGAIVTDDWRYFRDGKFVQVPGQWVHLPAPEAGELLLWIESAGGR